MPRADREALRDAFFPAQMALGWGFPNALMQYAIPDLEDLTIDTAALARRRDALMTTLTGVRLRRADAGGHLLPVQPLAGRRRQRSRGTRWPIATSSSCRARCSTRPDHFRISLTASDAMVERSLPAFREIAQSG